MDFCLIRLSDMVYLFQAIYACNVGIGGALRQRFWLSGHSIQKWNENENNNTSRLYRNIFIILTGIFWIGHISQYSTQLMNIASNFADNQE